MRIRFVAAIAASVVLAGCGTLGEGSNADEIAARLQANLQNQAGDSVFFPTNVSALGGRAKSILDRQADWLKENQGVSVVVEGHADHRGGGAFNQALGERRAQSVLRYLMAQGVPADRVTAVSFGENRPAAVPNSPAALAMNRRALTAVSVVTASSDLADDGEAPELDAASSGLAGGDGASESDGAPESNVEAPSETVEEGDVLDRFQNWF